MSPLTLASIMFGITIVLALIFYFYISSVRNKSLKEYNERIAKTYTVVPSLYPKEYKTPKIKRFEKPINKKKTEEQNTILPILDEFTSGYVNFDYVNNVNQDYETPQSISNNDSFGGGGSDGGGSSSCDCSGSCGD